MSFQVTGLVIEVEQAQQVSDTFKKRGMAISVQDGEYTNDVYFEAVQDRVKLFDGLLPGQEVTVHFNVRSRKYNDRYFTGLQAWKVERADAPKPAKPAPAVAVGGTDDDLPF